MSPRGLNGRKNSKKIGSVHEEFQYLCVFLKYRNKFVCDVGERRRPEIIIPYLRPEILFFWPDRRRESLGWVEKWHAFQGAPVKESLLFILPGSKLSARRRKSCPFLLPIRTKACRRAIRRNLCTASVPNPNLFHSSYHRS